MNHSVSYNDIHELQYEDAHSFTFNDTLYGPTAHLRKKTEMLLINLKRKIHILRSNGCNFSDLIRCNGACGKILSPDFCDVPVMELLIMQEVLDEIIIKLN